MNLIELSIRLDLESAGIRPAMPDHFASDYTNLPCDLCIHRNETLEDDSCPCRGCRHYA